MARRLLELNDVGGGGPEREPAERRIVETWSDRAVSVAAWLAVTVSLLSVTALPWMAA